MDLIAQNLSYKPEQEFHLNDVSFSMKKGQLYTILGRTLAGKTTLLKTIAGLLTPQQGTLTLDGQDFATVPVWQRNIAMVYQQFINYPHLSVFENVAFPLRQRKMDNTIINTKVMSALQNVGLMGFEDRKIQALSGGQQQRVALARSLAKEAGILLLDEPLVNLDYKIISGLAQGIDTAAHHGCIENNGIGIAIMAWFHKIYPPENKMLFNKILENGCGFSENPLKPEKNSPFRNGDFSLHLLQKN